jgi:hypothetical protein
MLIDPISLIGVTGEYQSPAATATHVHESAAGKFGPPRLAFPNPTGDDYKRTSFGCLKGPFRTGLNNTQTGRTSDVTLYSRVLADTFRPSQWTPLPASASVRSKKTLLASRQIRIPLASLLALSGASFRRSRSADHISEVGNPIRVHDHSVKGHSPPVLSCSI